ncbi:MAG TPA: PTS sugar transporter subunit IIB [Gemmatimonadales bacterium]|nr:PTS sugar transporter subunit IIB [Gemmatimonadales bacterium]
MPIVLCRVDDRLIHGQVVVGWGQALGVARIILVDDQVAGSPWEQDLYRMAVTGEMTIDFASIAEATAAIPGWRDDPRRTVLLTGDLDTMAALHRADPAVVHRINLGGVHHRPGRRERLPFLYLTDEEMRRLTSLETAGAEITAQDLPTTPPVALRALT